MKILSSNSQQTITDEKLDSAKLNDIYHSTSAEEMQLKIAMYGKKLSILDIIWLIDCVVYHASFWPHTLDRYNALCDLIKKDKDVRAIALSPKVISSCVKHSNSLEDYNNSTIDDYASLVPGKQMQIYYYIKIVEHILRLKLKRELANNRKIAKEYRETHNKGN